MIGYRCRQAGGDGDYSASYTAKVDGRIVKGSAGAMFRYNQTINQTVCDNVEIGNNIETTAFMFSGCNYFNSNVVIGKNVINAYDMFAGCNNFNSNVTLGKNLDNCYSMFDNCQIFNRNLYGTIKASNCQGMFKRCLRFNQPLNLADGVQDCSHMLESCYGYGQDITIPKTVQNCVMMLNNYNGTGNIFINGNPNVIGMLYNKNNSKRVNVFCNNMDLLSNEQWGYTLVYNAISWDVTAGGFYNSDFNIYIYSNYVGT